MGEKFSAQNTHRIVAVFMSCFFREDAINNIRMLTGVLPPRGYKPVFFSTIDDLYDEDAETEGERHVFQMIDVTRFDAIILYSESYKKDEDMLALIKKANDAKVPIITVDKYLPGCNANIYYDYGSVFDDVCEHMLNCHDFKNIYFMAGPEGNPFSDERIFVFRDKCKKYNYDFDERHLYYGGFWSDPCIKCMKEIFKKVERGEDTMPDCIICANDYMAFAVIQFLNQHGYRVPEDIAVSGFDGVPLEKYCTPRLTTAHINHDDFLDNLMDTLDLLSVSPRSQLGNITVSNYVQIGSSCGCHALVESHNWGFDYVQLANNMNSRLQYEHDVTQIVTGGNENTSFLASLSTLPPYLRRTNLLDFHLVANQDFVETAFQGFSKTSSATLVDGTCFTKKMYSINIPTSSDESATLSNRLIDYGDICTDIVTKLNTKNYLLCVPLHSDGKCFGYTVGEFNAKYFLYDSYSTFMISFLQMITNHMYQMKLMQVYMTDSLTGLYNRNGFYSKYEQIASKYDNRKKMSIISMDMDNLKKINDTYGHSEGDSALCELGQFIKNTDGYHMAARMGGDEFVLAVFGDDCEVVSEQVINNIKLQIAYRNAHMSGDVHYELHASIASFSAVIGEHSLDYFMKNADRRMYVRKKEHKEKIYQYKF